MSEETLEERAAGAEAERRIKRPRSKRPAPPPSENTEVEIIGAAASAEQSPVAEAAAELVANGADVSCAHLGLEHDPFHHYAKPSSEHRCYLWMQRDRIDRAHQGLFCLTADSRTCPWLAVSTPKSPAPLHRRVAEGISLSAKVVGGIEDMESPWQRAILTWLLTIITVTARAASFTWKVTKPLLLHLATAMLFGLRLLGPVLLWPMRWLSHHYKNVERAALHAPLRLVRRAFTASRRREVAESRPTAEGENDARTAFAETTAATVATVPLAIDGREMARLYVSRGLEAMRDGESSVALRRFRLATSADESDEQAWLWRGATAATPEEKVESFRRVLMLNPQSARARAALSELGLTLQSEGRASEASQQTGPPAIEVGFDATPDSLVEQGLGAMRSGDEDLAYQFFAMATRANPENEQAWYWQAKTSATVEEVVSCLRQIIAINPSNGKARSDLDWALQRQARALVQPAQQPKDAAAAAARSAASAAMVSKLRASVLQLASVLAFAGGLLAVLPHVVRLMDLPASPETQAFLNVLPVFRLPAMPVNVSFLPPFEFGGIAPLALGLLLLHAAFALGDGGGKAMRVWTAILGVAAVAMFASYVGNDEAIRLGTLLSGTAVATALAGKREESSEATRVEGSPYYE